MVIGVLCLLGGMIGAVVINYILHEPDHQIEDNQYRNSGHHGPKD